MTAYAISATSVGQLSATVDLLNKRAARLGVAPLSFRRTGAEWCTFRRGISGAITARREIVEVDLEGGTIGLPGWHFVGTVEHLDGVNVLRAVPGEQVPEAYRTGAQACDHCGLDRQRNDTFVVRHDDGTVKQLGRSCTADYLGHADPARLAAWLEAATKALDEAYGGDEDGEERERSAHVRMTYRPDEVVATAFGAIRRYGWVSAKAAEAIHAPRTSGLVNNWLGFGEAQRKLEAAGMTVTAEDYDEAERAVAWAREQSGNDYLRNLAAYAAQERVDGRAMGLLASLPSAYQRAMGQEVERRERAAQRAEAAPAPTGKVTVEGVVVGIKEQDNQYSRYDVAITKLTILTDAGWRLFVTEPAAIAGRALGDRVRMTVTVEPSRDDATFAWGKRPAKAEVLATAEAAPAAHTGLTRAEMGAIDAMGQPVEEACA